MPLEGDAKRDYQREYMRKKRAGQPTKQPKPKAEPKSTSQQKARVRDWLRRPWHARSHVGQKLTADRGKNVFTGENGPIDEAEAMRRYKEHLDRGNAPQPVEPKRCWFCGEPQSAERRLESKAVRKSTSDHRKLPTPVRLEPWRPVAGRSRKGDQGR